MHSKPKRTESKTAAAAALLTSPRPGRGATRTLRVVPSQLPLPGPSSAASQAGQVSAAGSAAASALGYIRAESCSQCGRTRWTATGFPAGQGSWGGSYRTDRCGVWIANCPVGIARLADWTTGDGRETASHKSHRAGLTQLAIYIARPRSIFRCAPFHSIPISKHPFDKFFTFPSFFWFFSLPPRFSGPYLSFSGSVSLTVKIFSSRPRLAASILHYLRICWFGCRLHRRTDALIDRLAN